MEKASGVTLFNNKASLISTLIKIDNKIESFDYYNDLS